MWKLLAVAALLVPGWPRLKHWAYAGVFFNMTGAALSHAYRAFVAASRVKRGDEVADAFEAKWSAHLVLVLDRYFVHRLRGQEGKDGNPLNEVRLLCASVLEHGGVMTGDKTITYDPARSVLAIPLGASVALTLAAVERLADAFFRAIDAKFTS